MGLFTPKISKHQLEFVRSTLTQLYESGELVNTTTSPDVFFKRLHFVLDLLLRLRAYEKYKIFKVGTPTEDYNRIISNIEATVNDFVDRAIVANRRKILSLKTEKARMRNYEKFVISLIAAFDCADSFWLGDPNFPHYQGSLYTERNYRRVEKLFFDLDKLNEKNISTYIERYQLANE